MRGAAVPPARSALLSSPSVSKSQTEHIRQLPIALQPIFLRCRRSLSDEEWKKLSNISNEQRFAALGMQLEGQPVNAIISYLLSCHSNSPAIAASASQDSGKGFSAAAKPHCERVLFSTGSPVVQQKPSTLDARVVDSSRAKSSFLTAARDDCPVLKRPAKEQQRSPAVRHKSPVPSATNCGASSSPVVCQTTRGRSPQSKSLLATAVPSLHRVVMPHRKSMSPVAGVDRGASLRLSRAVSPIAPPSLQRLVHPVNNGVETSTAEHSDDKQQESVTLSTPSRETSPLMGSPQSSSPARRSHSSSNVISRRASSTCLTSQQDSVRVRSYSALGLSPGSTPMPSPRTQRGDYSAVTGAPRTVSPTRASRWREDFMSKLDSVGLTVDMWRRLTSDEQEEFFVYWRMSQLQVSMVCAEHSSVT